jgi:hypothetical protein
MKLAATSPRRETLATAMRFCARKSAEVPAVSIGELVYHQGRYASLILAADASDEAI